MVLEKRAAEKSLSSREVVPANLKARGIRKGRASPPPYTKEEFKKFKKQHINPGSVHMVDGSGAYPGPCAEDGDELHSVSHDASRPGGPQWTKLVRRPGKKTLKAGTVSLDGLWAHLKLALRKCPTSSVRMDQRTRLFQWWHWTRVEDRWQALGAILRKWSSPWETSP